MEKLTKELNRGYVEYSGEKIMMYRNGAIQERFEELGIPVVDCNNKIEATKEIKKLFSKYEEDYPEAFQQNNWFYNGDKTKFDLFEQWRKDKKLDFAGYQSSDGEHYRSDRLLYSWLPVRIGSEFAYLWSNRGNQRAECDYGIESNATPIFGETITKEKTTYEIVKIRSTDGLDFREDRIGDRTIKKIKEERQQLKNKIKEIDRLLSAHRNLYKR